MTPKNKYAVVCHFLGYFFCIKRGGREGKGKNSFHLFVENLLKNILGRLLFFG
jgi:hypothetical protein